MPSVLFVCTGNQYRSPIAAAAFLRQLNQEGKAGQWLVGSAGTWTAAGLPALPDAIRIAPDLGLNLADHKTHPLDEHDLSRYDLVLVMERGHKEAILSEFPSARSKVHLISEVVDHIAYDIQDPANPAVDAGHVASQLCDLILRGSQEIYRLAEPGNGSTHDR